MTRFNFWDCLEAYHRGDLIMRALDISALIMVFVGGGIGSIFRYITISSLGTQFYLGTLIVNLTGSFFIGFVYNSSLSELNKTLVMAGLLGGLTTFSGFALDFLKLVQMGEITRAFLYFLITNLIAIAGCYLGYQLSVKN